MSFANGGFPNFDPSRWQRKFAKKNNKLENEQTSRGRSGHPPKTNMTMEHPHFGYRGPASSKGEFLFQLEAM